MNPEHTIRVQQDLKHPDRWEPLSSCQRSKKFFEFLGKEYLTLKEVSSIPETTFSVKFEEHPIKATGKIREFSFGVTFYNHSTGMYYGILNNTDQKYLGNHYCHYDKGNNYMSKNFNYLYERMAYRLKKGERLKDAISSYTTEA